MKIAIIDDEESQVELLTNLVQKWARLKNVKYTIRSFNSAESFQFEWDGNNDFDVLLLDIQMDKVDGITLAKEIREKDEEISIIFITGFEDYMSEGYEVSALHYLIKPVKEDKLFKCLTKANKRVKRVNPYIIVQIQGETNRINQNDIIYAEAFGHTTLIQTIEKKYEVNMSIGQLEKSLISNLFVKCHRSYLVSIKFINCITKKDIILDNKQCIPLSRRLYSRVNQAFITYFRGESIE